MRSKVYRQKVAEKLKMQKLNGMQKKLNEKEKDNLKKASALEKEIIKAQASNKRTKSSKPIPSDYEMCLEDGIYTNTMSTVKKCSKGKSTYTGIRTDEWEQEANRSTNNIKVLDSYVDSDEDILVTNNNIINPIPKNKAVNLKEINQRLKTNPKASQNINSTSIKLEDTQDNTNKQINYCDCNDSKDSTITFPKQEEIIYLPINREINKNFLSLKIEENVPSDLLQFGKYLVKYIEQEENYRLLFDKESKKLKQKIKTTFKKENTTDHCLLDYLFELWDKLEVSFVNRYKILSELARLNAKSIYKSLDKETEALTDYYHKTNTIFQLIKEREKVKLRLQNKSNKSNYY
jgi:hypothetical protein